MEFEHSGIFQVKVIPWDPTPSCFCYVMSLFGETYQFSK